MTAVERKVVHSAAEGVRRACDDGAKGRSRIATSSSSRDRSTGSTRLVRRDARADGDPRSRRGARACCSRTRCARVDVVRGFDGPIVDVGSGGGSPGIPLAAALPEREVTLLEAERRKCDFLERWAPAERCASSGAARRSSRWTPTASRWRRRSRRRRSRLEWCLPLVASGRRRVLWRRPERRPRAVAAVAERLGGRARRSRRRASLVLRKLEPTPAGFPRRPGVARKRPLA